MPSLPSLVALVRGWFINPDSPKESLPTSRHKAPPEETENGKPRSTLARLFIGIMNFLLHKDKTLQEDYIPSYRWLPIISGLIVPFSILLEVPGLTEHWYVRTLGFSNVEYRENSMLLNAGIGCSMAAAAIANLCLIVRFLERRILGATIAAIAFLLVHDIINTVALIIFGIQGRRDDGFSYSQAFWMTVFSTVASVVTTITLLLDYYRTPDFAKSGSGLTAKQRSLVIIVMILLTYLSIGALIYTFLIQDLEYFDALYFTIVSSLTIGFGDIGPGTPGAQIFSIFYNTFGILNTGLAIAVARDTIVEAFQNSYRKRKHILNARKRLHLSLRNGHHIIKRDMTKEAIEEATASSAAVVTLMGSTLQTALPGIDFANASPHTKSDHISVKPETTDQPESTLMDSASQAQEDLAYARFREEMAHEEKKEFAAKFWVSWGLFVTFWLLGSVIFMRTEGWSFGTAMYFCFTAFSTIGYGDVAPRTSTGRAIFIGWALGGVATMTILIAVLAELYQARYSTAISNGIFNRALNKYRNRKQEVIEDNEGGKGRNIDTMTLEERQNAKFEIRSDLLQLHQELQLHVKDLQGQFKFFTEPTNTRGEKLPPPIQRILDEEISEMSESLKKELMHHDDGRKTLLLNGMERRLQRLIEDVDRVGVLLKERDALEDSPAEEEPWFREQDEQPLATSEAVLDENLAVGTGYKSPPLRRSNRQGRLFSSQGSP